MPVTSWPFLSETNWAKSCLSDEVLAFEQSFGVSPEFRVHFGSLAYPISWTGMMMMFMVYGLWFMTLRKNACQSPVDPFQVRQIEPNLVWAKDVLATLLNLEPIWLFVSKWDKVSQILFWQVEHLSEVLASTLNLEPVLDPLLTLFHGQVWWWCLGFSHSLTKRRNAHQSPVDRFQVRQSEPNLVFASWATEVLASFLNSEPLLTLVPGQVWWWCLCMFETAGLFFNA